jgi:hypothetical protein
MLKAFFLSPTLAVLGGILLVGALALLGYGVCVYWGYQFHVVAVVVIAAAWAFASNFIGRSAVSVLRIQETLKTIALGVILCFLGAIITGLQLFIVDRIYLRKGRLDRFRPK